jgi:predicted O-methyltransferase YrrM
MDLNKVLELNNILEEGGYSRKDIIGNSMQLKEQFHDLSTMVREYGVENILEIGFNAGHSSLIFLESSPNTRVTSFELVSGGYTGIGKAYVDAMYPNRHTLISGDSTVTIPEFIASGAGRNFDLIFIDGGHEYEVAAADLRNCTALAGKDAIVIMDDTVYTRGWEAAYTTGPTRAWEEYLSEGKLVEIARKEYCPCRGMSWGRYCQENTTSSDTPLRSRKE